MRASRGRFQILVCGATGLMWGLCTTAQGPMNLHGLEKDIDVMIEAKCKERALLRFREAMVQPPSKDAVMASKFV